MGLCLGLVNSVEAYQDGYDNRRRIARTVSCLVDFRICKPPKNFVIVFGATRAISTQPCVIQGLSILLCFVDRLRSV